MVWLKGRGGGVEGWRGGGVEGKKGEEVDGVPLTPRRFPCPKKQGPF